VRALTAHRQPLAMAQTPIAGKIHQTLDVHRSFAAKVAFDLIIPIDGLANLDDFLIGQLVDPPRVGDPDLVDDLPRLGGPDAVNVLQRDNHALIGGNIDACDTGHAALLLITKISAEKRTVPCHPMGRGRRAVRASFAEGLVIGSQAARSMAPVTKRGRKRRRSKAAWLEP